MNTQTLIPILIGVAILMAVVLVAVFLAAVFALRNQRSQKLRQKYGPEYEFAMEKEGSQRAAEQTLAEREKRVSKLEIRELAKTERNRYFHEWMAIQASFVDDPSKAIEEANRLITEVMIARGFPVADFEQRAADLSVLFPDFVLNYRNAHDIVLSSQLNQTATEALRRAMVYFRSLFDELLGITEEEKVMGKELVSQ